MTNIALLASGGGSNCRSILSYFESNDNINVNLIITNNANAGVINIANEWNIPVHIIDNKSFKVGTDVVEILQKHSTNWVILAGFLRKIPSSIIGAFSNKIINIHPALLPKYGGKGMYGMNVHKAVFEAKEDKSGMTIHYVNEVYDSGNIIFQDFVHLNPSDLPSDIAKKVLKLEHFHYPRIIEKLIHDTI